MDDETKRGCGIKTHFAPPERASPEKLRDDIRIASRNPVIDGVMEAVSGLLAVLNEERQVVAVNDKLLDLLGIDDPVEAFGLRLGEAAGCVHARDEPDGCGTSRYCSTCGAVVAVVVALATDHAAEKECALTVEQSGKRGDLFFHVRCSPIVVEGQRFLLVFLRDISVEQQRAALERVFFHDVSNMVGSLVFQSQLLGRLDSVEAMHETADRMRRLTLRLSKEITVQKILWREPSPLHLAHRRVSVARVVDELRQLFTDHPAAKDKRLDATRLPAEITLSTDPCLLQRVVGNMLINAFEATEEGGEVRLRIEPEAEAVTFSVWNRRAIPEEVARRIFQRNFTTRPGAGRGLGTFAMRLLGETYLGGKVDFTSSETAGTLFHFRHPVHPA